MKLLVKKKELQNGILLGLKSVKDLIRAAAFLLLVAFLLNTWGIWFISKHHDGNRMMETFYAQPENSIDVLVVGSSHTFIDVNTGVLWEDFGIPSFVIGGSLQPFWNSYYFIKEALNYQHPRMIVLEAFACDVDFDYGDHGMIINNVSGMRMNSNKLEAIRASVTDVDGIVGQKTLDAINKKDPKTLFNAIKKARIEFVENLVKQRPKDAKFLQGWKNRINSFSFSGSGTASFPTFAVIAGLSILIYNLIRK